MKGRFRTDLINWLALVFNLTRGLFLLVSLGIPPALAATDCKQVTQISPPECETLVALYKSTDGPNWNDSQTNNWNVTNEPCQWAGITCENEHVTQINREYVNLVGTLPDLSALTFLQSLDLGTNCGLRCGYWQNSQLTGTLPNLSALTQLTFLDLSGNKFSGTINISSLPSSLQELYLESNQLEGSIPNFKEKLTQLTHLILSYNSLTGPIDGSYFPPSLKLLGLSGTPLNQPLSDLSSLINLTELDLGSAQLSGTIDANYFPKTLTTLYLDNNPFNQPLPNLSSLTHLINLYLWSTQLSGPINVSFFPTSLQSLGLGSNPLEGKIPSFSVLNNLHYLGLDYNSQLKGPIDASLFPLSLQNLDLSGIPLNQPIPNLSPLNNLITLGLNGTQLIETINAAYFPSSLITLHLEGNQLQGDLPDLTRLTKLSYLDLSSNQLQVSNNGSVDAANFPTSLSILGLANNQLDGTISDLSNLSNLSILNLSSNQLTGPIPNFPSNLGELYLNNNHLSGTIPTNLPTSLKSLHLNNNQLSGDIPLSFTTLTNLCSHIPQNRIYCQYNLELGYNHLNPVAKREIVAFLEAPGYKDPNWAATQTALLFLCPEGGSFGITPNPKELNFGTQIVGQSAIINVNTRSQDCGDLKLTGIEFVGTHKDEFTSEFDPQQHCHEDNATDRHYSSCQFTITFNPQLAEIKDDTSVKLVFSSNNTKEQLIPIQANAVDSGAPEIKVEPLTHDFGEVTLGESIDLGDNANIQVFTLTNSGNINLNSPTFEITGNNPLDFTFDSQSCAYKYILLPEEQENCEIIAQLAPTSAGNKQADLTIKSANAPEVKVSLTGTVKTLEPCLDTGITNESLGTGRWDDPLIWKANAVPNENDNVRIKSGHLIIGSPFAIVNALCIEEGGILISPNDKGTYLILHASTYLENKGLIKGRDGTDEIEGATTCNSDYWSTIGTENCAQPGASIILSVGHDPGKLFRNEGIIIAGNGGEGKLHHGYGGNISIYGNKIIDTVTETNCGIIKSGDGASVSQKLTEVIKEHKGITQKCLDVINESILISNKYENVSNESTNVTQIQPGRSGKGGDLTLIADEYFYTQGAVHILSGNGGNCNTAQTQGGNGGNLRFNASKRIDLSGGYLEAGAGSTNCQINGNRGSIFIEPSVISISGADTKINGGDITIFGGDDWVLELRDLANEAIKATNDITLAVGKNGIIDLRGNKDLVLAAGGKANIFSDEIWLDTGVNLHQVIKANQLSVGRSKIIYDVSLIGSGKFTGEPGKELVIPLTVANNGPKADVYQLEVANQQGWALSEIPSSVAVKELGMEEISVRVTLPDELGASNLITLTATSQADYSVTAVANVLVNVAQEIVTLPEMAVIPVTVTCDTDLPLLEAATPTMSYQLAGGAAVNGGLFEQQVTVKLADKVEIRGVLCAAEEVVGKDAEIVFYADYQPLDSAQAQSHYMRDNEGQVQAWDRTAEQLVALKSTVIELKHEESLYHDMIPVTGKVTLYFGYRLTDGTMVTNAKGIVVNVEP
jgi:Leucine-rich repeat (LRR) protein